MIKCPKQNLFYAINHSQIESLHIQNLVKSLFFSITGSQKINKVGMAK